MQDDTRTDDRCWMEIPGPTKGCLKILDKPEGILWISALCSRWGNQVLAGMTYRVPTVALNQEVLKT